MPSLTKQILDRSGARVRLRTWADLHRTTFAALAEKVGTSRQVIDAVAGGRYRAGEVLDRIAKAIDARPDWLLYGVGQAPAWWPSDTAGAARLVAEPVTASAGVLSMGWAGQVTAGGGFADPSQDADDWLPVVFKPHWRLVRVQGTSAHPILLSGQAAIVDDQVPVRDGRLVCLQTVDGRAYLKRWNTVGDHIVLAGLNSGVDSTVLHRDEIARVAVVVGTLYVDSVAR